MSDKLVIGGIPFNSRLIIGTGKFANERDIESVCKSSESEIITVALRRIDTNSSRGNIINLIPKSMTLLPNTSGAINHMQAVRIARLAREMGCGNFIKIEVISDNKYLLPDGYETCKATEILAKDGFIVMPYVNADLYIARSLKDAGASCVMPLGAPIGSNKGLMTKEMIKILVDQIDLPIIVDAGIGLPSQACEAMELGVDACLVNTAIASSQNPILMAEAFKEAIKAGRKTYLAGAAQVNQTASASSPLTGFLGE